MLHRAILGSFERFIGILIEHYAGKFPLWLAPVQAVVATIVSDADDYAREVAAKLAAAGIRVETDLRNEKINYKVREHSLAKVPLLLVVGKREAEEGTVALRRLGSEEHQKMMGLDEAVAMIRDEAVPPDLRHDAECATGRGKNDSRFTHAHFSSGARVPNSHADPTTISEIAIPPPYPRRGMAPPPPMSGPRFNEFIQSQKVRVIDENGENLGVMFTREAIEQARGSGSTWSRFLPTRIRRSPSSSISAATSTRRRRRPTSSARSRRRRRSRRSRCVRTSTTTTMTPR